MKEKRKAVKKVRVQGKEEGRGWNKKKGSQLEKKKMIGIKNEERKGESISKGRIGKNKLRDGRRGREGG